jgi:hypothetical protein
MLARVSPATRRRGSLAHSNYYPMHRGVHLLLDIALELPVNEQPQDQVCA